MKKELPPDLLSAIQRKGEIGRVAWLRGDPLTAEKLFLEAWALLPAPATDYSHAQILSRGLVIFYRDTQQFAPALRWLEVVESVYPPADATVQFLAGTVFHDAGDEAKAFALFDGLYQKFRERPFHGKEPRYLASYKKWQAARVRGAGGGAPRFSRLRAGLGRFFGGGHSMFLLVLSLGSIAGAGFVSAAEPAALTESLLGARLFDESRFVREGGALISCRTCHHTGTLGDAAVRSPVPPRDDGRQTTPRNSPPLVDAIGLGETLLHFDAEFVRAETLVIETITGRNYGWKPDERAAARRQMARVLRGLLPAERERRDSSPAGDDAVIDAGARALVAFLRTLQFSRDAGGRHDGSPYDAFLAANRLAQVRRADETPAEYSRRLGDQIAALRAPRWIDDPARRLRDGQDFRFGEAELQGARVFFRSAVGLEQRQGAGNCAECHPPPHFLDFKFHNTGVAQDDYDAVHGAGAFRRLAVPDAATRDAAPERWLPATERHPSAAGVFFSPIDARLPGRADLGLWNVYANADFPAPQAALENLLNPAGRLSRDEVLSLALARFKTSGLRALGASAPYFHTGRATTLEESVRFYQRTSGLAREGKLRNAPPEFFAMRLADEDIPPLTAFLRALNEDYPRLPAHGAARPLPESR